MNGKISLCVCTSVGEFKIPFATIRQLDMFTVRYKNRNELIESLVRILDLPVDIDDVYDIRMQYVYSDKYLPIKYSEDNYNTESVIEAYISYLQTDQRRLDGYGIRNVMKVLEPDYKNKSFSNSYVEIIARRYLKEDYRKIRDVYFLLKKSMIIKIDKVTPRKEHSVRVRSDDVDDEYIDYLIGCLKRGDDEALNALEELSMMDLEVLESKLSSYDQHVIDGVENEKYDVCDLDDIKELVRLTGIDIDSLRYIVCNENWNKKKR